MRESIPHDMSRRTCKYGGTRNNPPPTRGAQSHRRQRQQSAGRFTDHAHPERESEEAHWKAEVQQSERAVAPLPLSSEPPEILKVGRHGTDRERTHRYVATPDQRPERCDRCRMSEGERHRRSRLTDPAQAAGEVRRMSGGTLKLRNEPGRGATLQRAWYRPVGVCIAEPERLRARGCRARADRSSGRSMRPRPRRSTATTAAPWHLAEPGTGTAGLHARSAWPGASKTPLPGRSTGRATCR